MLTAHQRIALARHLPAVRITPVAGDTLLIEAPAWSIGAVRLRGGWVVSAVAEDWTSLRGPLVGEEARARADAIRAIEQVLGCCPLRVAE